MSLAMLDAAGASPDHSVLDGGGGASTLVDGLLDAGYTDLTVLDISATGLDHARQRLGPRADRVNWVVADVLTWRPNREYRIWHDRAVLHFLTTDAAREQYLRTLDAATPEAAVAVIGCFAPDGPQYCSGLPVARYDADALAGLLGGSWQLVADAREEHSTPAGAVQPFTWTAFRRR